MSFSKQYTSVPTEEDGEIEKHGLRRDTPSRTYGRIFSLLFTISIALNIFALVRSSHSPPPREPPSKNAGLVRNVPYVVRDMSPFNDPDPIVQDAAWDSELVRARSFAVALDDSYADAQGLQRSMRWPWDKNKGVYIIHSGHKLHCLHLLRDAANDQRDGGEPRWSHTHQIHCIELLLQDVMCDADDTLMYTGFLHDSANATGPTAGAGSKRMCRDWTKLRAWADEHSACYHPLYEKNNPNVTEKDRYKFCPDGSEPWKKTSLA